MKVKIWCEQHGITAKAIDYHTRRLRRKGYTIPQRISQTIPCEKQEVVCLDISQSLFADQEEISSSNPWTVHAAVFRLDFQGTHIEISNYAAKETIENTLLALRSLC